MIKHHYVVPALSYLPDVLLRWLMKRFPHVGSEPDDGIGWNLWLDASYHAWCRRDQRRKARS